jgi:hypothetical protein
MIYGMQVEAKTSLMAFSLLKLESVEFHSYIWAQQTIYTKVGL